MRAYLSIVHVTYTVTKCAVENLTDINYRQMRAYAVYGIQPILDVYISFASCA